MIRIGTFSRISQVPVSTLRYYDELGLLRAARVDEFTGYRYYILDQLPRLQRILVLKEMGLGIKEIRHLLAGELSAEELKRMLRAKQDELQAQIQAANAQLSRLKAWLEQIEQEETMEPNVVSIKKVDPMRVVSVRDVLNDYSEQGRLWDELGAYVQTYGIPCGGPGVTVYHEEQEGRIDTEVCLLLPSDGKPPVQPVGGRGRIGELPGVEQMAFTVYHGPLEKIGEGIKPLLQWIERQGYRINGPTREVYLRGPENHSQTDPNVIVELQFPVEKV